MPGLILETAAAVGDIVVNCSSVSSDVELTGPCQKAWETITLEEMPFCGLLNQLSTKYVYLGFHIKYVKLNRKHETIFQIIKNTLIIRASEKQTSEFRTWQKLIGIVKFFLKDLDSFFKLDNTFVWSSIHLLQLVLKVLVNCHGRVTQQSKKQMLTQLEGRNYQVVRMPFCTFSSILQHCVKLLHCTTQFFTLCLWICCCSLSAHQHFLSKNIFYNKVRNCIFLI